MGISEKIPLHFLTFCIYPPCVHRNMCVLRPTEVINMKANVGILVSPPTTCALWVERRLSGLAARNFIS